VLVFDNASDTSSIFIDFNPTLSSPIPVILTGVISSGQDSRSAILTAAVPEPSTWAMMILGFMGIGFMAYRKNSHTKMAFNAA
jgi:PEP-CTERM motif